MRTRLGWALATLLIVVGPTWAHCGVCGKGEKKAKTTDAHAHAALGKPAPDFALKDVDGTEHKLSDFKGKVVVLEWTNHACPVVNRCHSSKIMSKTLAKFKGKPVVWLAINSTHTAETNREAIREWSQKNDVAYPVLLDASGEVGHLYGARTTPHMFVIDQKGVLAFTGAIDNDEYGKKDQKRNYVEMAVTALLSGSTVTVDRTRPYGCSVKYKS